MLYHVPDIAGAVRNCSRLLSPSGTFLATTNSGHTMQPYCQAVWSAVHERLPQIEFSPTPVHSRFALENGAEYLVPSFDCIELRSATRCLPLHRSSSVGSLPQSGRELDMSPGHTEEEWQQVARVMDDVVQAQLVGGVLVVPKIAGAFLCRAPQPHLFAELQASVAPIQPVPDVARNGTFAAVAALPVLVLDDTATNREFDGAPAASLRTRARNRGERPNRVGEGDVERLCVDLGGWIDAGHERDGFCTPFPRARAPSRGTADADHRHDGTRARGRRRAIYRVGHG